MSHTTITGWFSAACPWLALVLVFQSLAARCGLNTRGWGRLSLLGFIAIGILAVPVQGLALAGWVTGVNANFSIPLTGLLAAAVWEGAFSRKLLSARDWSAGWAFGAIAGLLLYPLALGWGKFDPYGWDVDFSPLFVGGAMLTVLLIWKENRFGLLLLLAILAFHLRLLESTNYWDYLLDPVYCLASIFALGWRLPVRFCRRKPQPEV